jgi:hypothetical protein
MRNLVCALLLSAAATAVTSGETHSVAFSMDQIGQSPRGFEFAHTAGIGRPGQWVVQDDNGNKVLAQTDTDSTRARFAVAVLSNVAAVDVDLSVRIRPVSGQVDQAGGLVWRYQNQDNYYLVRANALEDNVVLYKVEGGKRTDLPLKSEGRTYGKKTEVPAAQWSTLRVDVRGRLFEVYLNGVKLYEVEDSTFTAPGKIGLWTKADSVTQFDDLSVVTR